MTEPTDAELDELRQANSGKLNFVTFSEFRTIARAVLAKWGAQPTQAQAGAVPLTPEQIKDEASHHGFIGSTEMLVKFVRGIEAHHGITGGQHGTE